MEAHADLAQCYMAVNNIDEAMSHIKTYQRLTETQGKTDMLNMKADAERHLANLYWKKGDRENALKNYKAFFQDAKNDKVNKDRKLVDNARISLGLARGTHNMGKGLSRRCILTEPDAHFEEILKSKIDIHGFIAWKFKTEK